MTTLKFRVIFMAELVLAVAANVGEVVAAEASVSEAQAKSSSMPLTLKVKGTQVLNSENKPVLLRGVNAACLEWTSDGNGVILKTVQVAIDDWHVNIIRLPLSQDRWFGKAPEQNDAGVAYRALVEEIVDLCSSKGCYIILDLHWSNAGEWGTNIGQHSMPDENSVVFWKDLAPIYANHPAVLFDLYNEPHDVTWDVWLKGGMIKDRPNRPGSQAKTYEAVGMQKMLDTIRAAGAKNIVVAGGLDWAYDFSGILDGRQLKDAGGNGVIYANHAYDNKRESVFTWISKMEEASAKLPVIVSEFGGSGGPNRRRGWWGQSPSTAMGDDWLLHVLQAIQDHNWSFTAWDLHTAAGPTLIADWNYTPTPEFGVYVKELLVTGKLPRYTPPDFTNLVKASASALPKSACLGGKEIYGDWQIKADPCEQRGGSILSFAGDSKGRLIGQWINSRGFSELEDVRFKDNSVTFTQTIRFGKETFKGNFAGTIEGDKIAGTLTHGGNQSKMEGKRDQIIPLAAGTWDMKFKTKDGEIAAILAIKVNKDETLSAEWQSQPIIDHKITNVQYEGGKLTFKSTRGIENIERETTFEGTIQQKTDTLTGVFKTKEGEMPARAKRIGSELIGTWYLDITTPGGNLNQRLKVNPDMSGIYGTTPIDKISLEGDKVSFKVTPEFGRQRFETTFEGKLDGSKLTGELKNQRGPQVLVGKKVSRI
ncbi:MAG: glycoside hydrolase family 5 protein [Sedimentisphaerales bacterium]